MVMRERIPPCGTPRDSGDGAAAPSLQRLGSVFWMDLHDVSNGDLPRLVTTTGYVTILLGGLLVAAALGSPPPRPPTPPETEYPAPPPPPPAALR